MHLRTITIDSAELITAAMLAEQLGVGFVDEQFRQRADTILIPAAISFAEAMTGLAIQAKELEYTRKHWPTGHKPIELPRPPHRCVKEIAWRFDCDDWQTLPETDFRIVKDDVAWEIHPCKCWPIGYACDCSCMCNRQVKVTFEAGYIDLASMPATLVSGILLYAEHLFDRSNEETLQLATQQLMQHASPRPVGHFG